jgi:hypothetical protein
MNRLDELLTKITNNEPIGDWTCQNRLEQFLFCIIARGTAEAEQEYAELVSHYKDGKPLNLLEEYLDVIYQMVPENTGQILGEIIAARLEQIDPEPTLEAIEVISGRLEEIEE